MFSSLSISHSFQITFSVTWYHRKSLLPMQCPLLYHRLQLTIWRSVGEQNDHSVDHQHMHGSRVPSLPLEQDLVLGIGLKKKSPLWKTSHHSKAFYFGEVIKSFFLIFFKILFEYQYLNIISLQICEIQIHIKYEILLKKRIND